MNIKDLFQELKNILSDPIISLVVASVIGVISNILTGELMRRVKRVWWGIKSASLEAEYFGKTGKLRIAYQKGKKSYQRISEKLIVCRFVFWSSGKETLLDTDVSEHDPIGIHFGKDCEILEIRPVAKSNPSMRYNIVSPNFVGLKFEYLDHGQGAVFDIIYTGKEVHPELVGAIKGGEVKTRRISPPPMSMTATPRLYLLFGWMKPALQINAFRWFSTIALVFLLWGLLLMSPGIFKSTEKNTWLLLSRIILSIIAYGLVSQMFWRIAVIPVELREFYSSIE